MNTLGQILAFGAANVFLGATLTIGLLIYIAGRHGTDGGEGCFGVLFCLALLAVSGLFLVMAFGE